MGLKTQGRHSISTPYWLLRFFFFFERKGFKSLYITLDRRRGKEKAVAVEERCEIEY